MNPSREVVITGVGVVSPIGIGRQAYWQSLAEGSSGVAPLTLYDGKSLPVSFGAELKGFDARQYVRPRKALKVMCREIQTAFSAAMLAVEDAELDPARTVPERIGSVFGSQMLYGDVLELVELYQSCMVNGQFCFDRFGERVSESVVSAVHAQAFAKHGVLSRGDRVGCSGTQQHDRARGSVGAAGVD